MRAGALKLAAARWRQAPEALAAVGTGLGGDPAPSAQRRQSTSQSSAINDEAFAQAPLGYFSRARECHQQTELCDVYPAAPNLLAVELGDGAGGPAEVGAGAEKGGYFNFFALRCSSACHNNTCIYIYTLGLSSYFFTRGKDQLRGRGSFLLREVHAAEEGVEAGVGARSSRHHIRNKKVRY